VLSKVSRSGGLEIADMNSRGWLMDVLNCVNRVPTSEFTLRDIYNFEPELQIKHPQNKNVKAKIRQQLQFLRDKGFLEFTGVGKYKKVGLDNELDNEMKRYTVAIEETLVGEFEVIAASEEEALELARRKYKESDFVLEPGELQHAQMAIVKPRGEELDWREI
jgi:hypothetical protein